VSWCVTVVRLGEILTALKVYRVQYILCFGLHWDVLIGRRASIHYQTRRLVRAELPIPQPSSLILNPNPEP